MAWDINIKNKKFDQIGMYNNILPVPMEDREKNEVGNFQDKFFSYPHPIP